MKRLLHDLQANDRRRRERTVWRMGLLLSVLVHLFIFLGWRGPVIPMSPFAAAGPRAGDNRAARGSMQALNMSVPPSRPIIRPPRPLAVSVEIEPVEFEDSETLDPSSVLGDAPGDDEGPGLETGTGEGDGGTAEEGLYRLQPPSPRGMIIPPANENLKGTTVEVWVFVDERGRVVPDSTRLNPPTRDRGFNQRLIREAAEWVFRPAVQGGKPVASWFPYQISM
ncbi:MAG: hypothetical protein P8170_09895 [Gemmatimonadota bacterium]